MGDLFALLHSDATVNLAIKAIVLLTVLDFITGTARAIAGKTFTFDSLDAWTRKHLLSVIVITATLVTSLFIGDIQVAGLDLNVVGATGLAAAGTYGATTIKSIVDNVNLTVADKAP